MIKKLSFNGKTLRVPLIQGGMGVGVSLSNLAGNVAKCGAMGVISAAQPGFMRDDFRSNNIESNVVALQEEIHKAKQISQGKGMIAVNAMVASAHYVQLVKASIAAKADAIISGAGLPLDLPELVKGANILIAPIVSSKKAVDVILKSWDRRYKRTPDFVVIESAEAGGHLGFKKEDLLNDSAQPLSEILSEVKQSVHEYEDKYEKDIPVYVAGGIYDGADIQKYLNEGADGVQMATRFIATHECDAHIAFKEAVVNCKKEDIAIVQSPTGFSGRALWNDFYKAVEKRGNISMKQCLRCVKPCTPQDTPYCISEALIQSVKGNVNQGVVFVGSNAYKIKEIVSVKELIDSLFKEVKI